MSAFAKLAGSAWDCLYPRTLAPTQYRAMFPDDCPGCFETVARPEKEIESNKPEIERPDHPSAAVDLNYTA